MRSPNEIWTEPASVRRYVAGIINTPVTVGMLAAMAVGATAGLLLAMGG